MGSNLPLVDERYLSHWRWAWHMTWRHLVPVWFPGKRPGGTAIVRHVKLDESAIATEYICPCKFVRIDMEP